jgi:hypothetical protein
MGMDLEKVPSYLNATSGIRGWPFWCMISSMFCTMYLYNYLFCIYWDCWTMIMCLVSIQLCILYLLRLLTYDYVSCIYTIGIAMRRACSISIVIEQVWLNKSWLFYINCDWTQITELLHVFFWITIKWVYTYMNPHIAPTYRNSHIAPTYKNY